MDTLHAKTFLFKPIYLNVSHCFHLLFMASFYLPAAILCSGDVGTTTTGVVKSLCIEEERRALLSFKNELVDRSGRLSSWVGQDYYLWEGISCNNSTGRVVKMNLRNPYPYPFSYSDERWDESAHEQSCLGGTINASLLTLKYLKYLDLSMNNFHGIIPIPNFFGQLNSLQYLNLSSSSFGGEIPYSLGNLSSLNFLDLGLNYNLSSRNLSWLSHLSSLKYLNLEGIDLSSTGVSWAYDINRLPSLLELHLSSCQIKSIPLSLQKINFTYLLILDLSDDKINFAFPSWLFNFTSLKELNLARNNLTSPFPSEFANSKSLESLDLSATGLKGQIPKVIGNLCKLKFLSLRANDFDGGGIEEFWRSFSDCSNNSLESLDLSFCGLESQLSTSLGMLKSLQNLDLCGNHLWGSIPDSIGNFSSLKTLDLSYNYMNGSIPESIGQLTELVSLHLYLNIWEGILTESHFINLTSLQDFQVGDARGPMSLSFEVAYDWVPPFKLHTIEIINCRIGPGFGVWLRSQTELVNVNLRGNEISKNSIPEEWLSKISTQVVYLILAHNQFSGNLPTHLNFPNSMVIDLSRNNLVGLLPLWSTNVSLLYLQSNSFSEPIPSDIDQLMPNLKGLYLFENHLNGVIPSSVCNIQSLEVLALRSNEFSREFPHAWRAGSNLLFLDASHNNLSGNIPPSLGVLSLLEILKLNNNSFDGKIPDSLQNCSGLRSIDLGDNILSGKIPLWIGGSNVAMLYMLQLRSNLFTGHIPHNLCNLSHLHILDLSHNNFSGMIPNCVNNLASLVREENLEGLHYGFYEQATLTLKGGQHLYNTTLILVKSIDLSSNVLEGEIPEEICSLVLLGTLNLSMNQLIGKIPSKIGNMHLIETLDLSHNHLSGQMSQSLSSLNFLSHLNLSYNNLSGRILSGNQLQTLNDLSIYMNNPLLCGVPLSTQCPGDDLKDAKDKNEDGNDKLWFYASMVLGFIVGFWGVCGTLVLKTSWRYAYFRFFDDIKDKVMG